MAYIVADRVKETTTVTGTGPATLAGAASGYRSFASQLSIGDTCAYVIVNSNGSEWEVGIGTYSAVNTLTRTTVHASTNSNAAVVFTAGVKDVFLGPTSGSFPKYNPITNTITSGTWAGNSITPSQVSGTAVITTDSRLSDSRTPSGSAGGDLTGSYPNPTLAAVGTSGIYTKVTTDSKGRIISGTTLSASDVPSIDPSQVTGTAVITSDSRLSDSRTPSGSAGGVLAGTYPSPSFASTTGSGSVVLSTTPTLVTPQSNSLSAVPVGSGAGNSLTLAAGSGVGTGAGGNLVLQAGIQATSGGDGKVVVKQASGQTGNLLEIQNSSGTALISASSNANLTIGTTTTNQRLIIQSGTNAQNSEPAFVVKNAAGANVFFVDAKRSEVAIGSALYFGQGGATTAYLATSSQGNFAWVSGVTTAPDTDSVFAVLTSGNIIKSGGTTSYIGGIVSGCKFFPTSGTSSYASFVAASTINQTSTASGTVRGLYVNDTLTSVLGTYRAIETTYGNALINTGNAAYKGLLIQAATAQTANLQEWQNSSGTALAYITASGALYDNAINAVPLPTAATVTAATGNGTTVTYTCASIFAIGQVVSITGLTTTTGSSLNLSNQTITGVTATAFTVTNATVGTAAATQAGTATIQSAGNSVTITGGSGSGVGAGGNIILQPGAQGSSGGNGQIRINTSAGVDTGFNFSNTYASYPTLEQARLYIRSGSNNNVIEFRADLGSMSSSPANSQFLFGGNNANYVGIRENGNAGTLGVICGSSSAGGSLNFISSTTAIAANTNDLALSASAFQRISCTTNPYNLTGIAPVTGTGSAHKDGRMIRIYNVGTPNLTLSHNSASSTTPTNRFWNSTGADIVLSTHQYVELIYDSTDNGRGGAGWRVSSIH